MKKILVACERSQVVTSAFRQLGVVAYSCDIEKQYGNHPEWHIKCDVMEILKNDSWTGVIAFPPCTYLTKVSAVAKSSGKQTAEQIQAARSFFLEFTKLNVPTCIENPVPLKTVDLPHWSQTINPCDFGHDYTKLTCLWLYGLPPLLPMHGYYDKKIVRSWIDIVGGNTRKRSRFHENIAMAMATQWKDYF